MLSLCHYEDEWFASYLTNKKWYTEINKYQSSLKNYKLSSARIHTWANLIFNLCQ